MLYSQSMIARVALFLLAGISLWAGSEERMHRLPPSQAPELYLWVWNESNGFFTADGGKKYIDLFADHSNFGLFPTIIRSPRHEVTFPETHDAVKQAVDYAHKRGLRVAFELDVRTARGTFLKEFPEQQQWMLRMRAFPGSATRLEVQSSTLSDHMGLSETLSGRFVRLWTVRGDDLREVRADYRVAEESRDRVVVETGPGTANSDAEWILATSFEYKTPDVFAPALLDFQKRIFEQYRDVRLDGAMKDEWGFPPVFNQGPRDGDFWYSKAFAAEYAKAGGGDLLNDSLLMWRGAGGPAERRIAAINRYERMILVRNAAVERSFYDEAKRVFGPDAFVCTHPTWGFMPFGDAFKNGYDWWWAPRTYGQTDEHWPLPVRTSLAKKAGKPLWYNQFYARDPEAYATEVWRNARAGGRVSFHPLYPSRGASDRDLRLLRSPAMRAASRVRLLNFITKAPLDCPVAVVFGHAAAVNWVGSHFGDLGVDFAEDLWARGVPADVIPSTEIESGALQVGADGFVRYGVQRYRALVFINPEFEPPGTFGFLRQAARSSTVVFLRGKSEPAIPGAHAEPTPSRVAEFLWNWHSPRRPSPPDLARLTDGTCLLARGEQDPAGDEFEVAFYCGSSKVEAHATGVFGVRLTPSGALEALAAAGLRRVRAGSFQLELAEPVDLAIWRNAKGELEGVVQGATRIPPELGKITSAWTQLFLEY